MSGNVRPLTPTAGLAPPLARGAMATRFGLPGAARPGVGGRTGRGSGAKALPCPDGPVGANVAGCATPPCGTKVVMGLDGSGRGEGEKDLGGACLYTATGVR